MGAEIRVHDPYVEHWWELEEQESYPATGQSKARFFHRQERLGRRCASSGTCGPRCAGPTRSSSPCATARTSISIPTPWCARSASRASSSTASAILDDERIRRYFELGCEVKGMGRGHIQRLKESVRRRT